MQLYKEILNPSNPFPVPCGQVSPQSFPRDNMPRRATIPFYESRKHGYRRYTPVFRGS